MDIEKMDILKTPFYFGSYPEDIAKTFKVINGLGVRRIINLASNDLWHKINKNDYEDQLDLYHFEYVKFPIKDYGVPNYMPDFIQIINETFYEINKGKKIFVHCVGGNGRTGLFVSGLLIKALSISSKQAITLLRGKRPKAVESLEQREFLYNYSLTKIENNKG